MMKNHVMGALVGVLALAGCSEVGFGQKLYEAQHLALTGGRRALTDLIVTYAHAQHWVIVSTSVGPNPTVEALSPNVDVSGMTLRNRWLFWAEDNQVRVVMQLEVRFDPAVDVWESSPVLCETYEYQNEQRQLQGLAELAASRNPPMVVAAGDSAVRN